MLGQGQDLYNYEVYKSAQLANGTNWFGYPYFYPVALAILFIPMGLIPLQIAALIWETLSIMLVILTVFLVSSRSGALPVWPKILIILAGIFLFRPVIVTLRNGQLGAVLLCILVAALYFLSRQKWQLGGGLLAFLLLKPSLGLPIVGLICIYLLLTKFWKALISFGTTTFLLLALSFLIYPNWIAAFIRNSSYLGKLVSLYTPTIWGQAGMLCHHEIGCSLWVGSTCSLLLIALTIWFILHSYPKLDIWQAGILSVLVSLLVTPYLWAYDQIFLILPILTITFTLISHNPRPFMAAFPLLVSIVALVFLYLASLKSYDEISFWLTVLIAIISYLVLYKDPHVRSNLG
jgi:alpha-1,2-mannosyltransferase